MVFGQLAKTLYYEKNALGRPIYHQDCQAAPLKERYKSLRV